MTNPFEIIEARLCNIETLLIDLKFPAATPTPADHDQDILTVDEAAVFLRVKRPTIYGYLYTKQIPSLKKRGRVYFRKSELMKWLGEGSRMSRKEITLAAAESLAQ